MTEQPRINLIEDFKEKSKYLKWTSYVIWATAIAAFVLGAIWLSKEKNLLSQVITGIRAGTITSDNISPILSASSIDLSLAFGAIALGGILTGSAIALYAEWRSINLKAYSEYLIRNAVKDIKDEIRSNRLNLGNSTSHRRAKRL